MDFFILHLLRQVLSLTRAVESRPTIGEGNSARTNSGSDGEESKDVVREHGWITHAWWDPGSGVDVLWVIMCSSLQDWGKVTSLSWWEPSRRYILSIHFLLLKSAMSFHLLQGAGGMSITQLSMLPPSPHPPHPQTPNSLTLIHMSICLNPYPCASHSNAPSMPSFSQVIEKKYNTNMCPTIHHNESPPTPFQVLHASCVSQKLGLYRDLKVCKQYN